MNTADTPASFFEKLNSWIQESVMVKLVSIGFLVLILLIPSAWIQELIREREERAGQVMEEVASKWSGSQMVSGPVLVVPFRKYEPSRTATAPETVTRQDAFFLPEQLSVEGTLEPTVLHRGIFDAIVYTSSLGFTSRFAQPDFASLGIPDEDVLWKEAYIAVGITELRGISEDPVIKIGGIATEADPSGDIGLSLPKPLKNDEKPNSSYSNFSTTGIVVRPKWNSASDFKDDVNLSLSLKGGSTLAFVPTGKTTNVKISGPWKDPSFNGSFLPENRQVSDTGFSAEWKVNHFNRTFSQQWTGADQQLTGSDFGVELLVPVDQYQKSVRTAKYGAMIILFTFVAMFMVEITRKIRIHPFQYILIGAALTIYYTLLISISEHFGYNVSYIISSVATIALITLYAQSFMQSWKLSSLLAGILALFYAFIFIIIREQDYALLLGSVGLFITLGLLMFFSRNIDWYRARTIDNGITRS